MVDAVCRSVDLLMEGKVDFEFRTTVVRELHELSDFDDIGKWISGAPRYFLQQFKDSGDLIDKQTPFSAYNKEEMEALLEVVKKYIPTAELRGV